MATVTPDAATRQQLLDDAGRVIVEHSDAIGSVDKDGALRGPVFVEAHTKTMFEKIREMANRALGRGQGPEGGSTKG